MTPEGQCPDCAYVSMSLCHDGLRCGLTQYRVERDDDCERFTWRDEKTRLRQSKRKGTNHG